jgi:hypothetical protein
LRAVHADSTTNKKPGKLSPNRVSLALAEFIKRPQAVPQIGANSKYHALARGVNLQRIT